MRLTSDAPQRATTMPVHAPAPAPLDKPPNTDVTHPMSPSPCTPPAVTKPPGETSAALLRARLGEVQRLDVGAVFSPPSFTPVRDVDVMPAAASEVVHTVATALTTQLLEVNYNSMAPVLRFLQHLHSGAGTDLMSLLHGFHPRALDDIAQFGGSACIGLSQALAAQLNQQLGFGFVCPVELPPALRQGSPYPFGHGAVCIPFADPKNPNDSGVVVLDPGLSFPVPIVVRSADATVFDNLWTGKERWSFSFGPPTPQLGRTVVSELTIANSMGGGTSAFFVDQRWHNSDELQRLASTRTRALPCGNSTATHAMTRPRSLRALMRGRLLKMANGQRVRVPAADRAGIDAALTEPLARLLLPHIDDGAQAQRTLREHVHTLLEGTQVLLAAKTAALGGTP